MRFKKGDKLICLTDYSPYSKYFIKKGQVCVFSSYDINLFGQEDYEWLILEDNIFLKFYSKSFVNLREIRNQKLKNIKNGTI